MSDKRVKKWLIASRKKSYIINSTIVIKDKAKFNNVASVDINVTKIYKIGTFDGSVTIDLKEGESLEYIGRYSLDYFLESYGFLINIDL